MATYRRLNSRCLLLLPVFLVGLFCAVSIPNASADLFKPEERFLGMVNDGTRVNADKVLNWHDATVQPTLAGKAIFDANNPFRWLIDQSVPLGSPPEASIEFFGGDCLPARVVEYQPARTDGFGVASEMLIVEPLVSVSLPGRPVSAYLRINPQWTKRIVFERPSGRSLDYQPGMAFLHDGSQIGFRAVRWGQGVVSVLTENGVQSLLLSQLAELHMPQRDIWEVWFEQLGALLPDLNGRLVQCESSEGLRLTASTQRLRPQYYGDKDKSDDWYPLLQPAWSFDPITIPFKVVRTWRFFAPESLPATAFHPDARRDGPVFSSGWNWQRDRGVQNSPLRSNQLLAGWGFGVHAPTVLMLPLNPVVTGLRCRVGLDHSVGQGGCARASIELTSAPGKSIWQSPVLVGSAAMSDTGWINIATQPEQTSVALVADPMLDGRPANSDPFDIRDCLDWMEPEWRIDREKLQIEVAARHEQRISSLRGWAVAASVPGSVGDAAESTAPALAVSNVWDITWADAPGYELTFQPAGQVMTLSRDMKVNRQQRWLAVSVNNRRADAGPTIAQIRVNGRAMLQRQVPLMKDRTAPNPLLVPLDEFLDQKVRVDVVLMSSGESPQLVWDGAHLLETPPGIVRVFDDNADIIEHFTEGEGELTLSTQEPFQGSAALKLTSGDRLRARLPGLNIPVREYPQLGEFRFLSFAWKVAPAGQGRQRRGGLGLQIGHNGELGIPRSPNETRPRRPQHVRILSRVVLRGTRAGRPLIGDDRGSRFGYQYMAGNVNEDELALNLDRASPEQWKLMQRDLFAEFGAFDVTGLGLRLFAGDAAWFDHIYLYRTTADYDWVRELSSAPREYADANIIGEYAKVRNMGRLLSAVAPQFSVDGSGEPVQLLKEFRGRQNICRTMPFTKDKPCTLLAPVTIPTGKKTVLRLSASHRDEADWLLTVNVADKELYRSNVDANTAKEGWLDHEVDLTGYAGQTIVVQVQNHPTGWHYEHAYWQRLEVVSQ